MFDDILEEDPNHESGYSQKTVNRLTFIYIVAVIIWTIFYYFVGAFNQKSIFYKIVYFVPIIIFGISIYFLHTVNHEIEQPMNKANFLSLGLVIFFPIFSIIVTKYRGNKTFFITLMVSAFILSLITLYDIWISDEYQPILRHIKTILQTFTITLIIIAMYTYYLSETDPSIRKNNASIPLMDLEHFQL